MSLEEFQKATSDLIASPELCRLLQKDPEAVLSRYGLSARDQRRLVDLVQQPGMSVNCTLYRFNRITPLYTLLPLTNFVMGEKFISEAELFWNSFTDSDPRFRQEVDRFGDFLFARLRDGRIDNAFLEETLAFELATNELRFAQRGDLLSGLQPAGERKHLAARVAIHPLVRLVPFRHEPAKLLQLLKERRRLPYELPEDEYWLLLDILEDELRVRRIDARVGRTLQAIADNEDLELTAEDVEALLSAGMIVRTL